MKNDTPYGFCPVCNEEGVSRERRPDGNDRCRNGHTYPSANALKEKKPPVIDKEAYIKALAALMPIFCDIDVSYGMQACDFANEDVFASITWFPQEITFEEWDKLRTLVNSLELPEPAFWREDKNRDGKPGKNKERRLMRRLCVFTKALQQISRLGGAVGLAAERALIEAPAPELLDEAFKPAAEAADILADVWADYAPIAGYATEGKEKHNEWREAHTPTLEKVEKWLKEYNIGGAFPKDRVPKDRVYEAECENERLKREVCNAEISASWAKNSAKRDVKNCNDKVNNLKAVVELVANDQALPKNIRELAAKALEVNDNLPGLETNLEDAEKDEDKKKQDVG